MLHWPKDLLMLERPFTPEEAEQNAWQTADMCEHHIQRALWRRHRGGASAILPNYTPHGWYESDLYVVLNSGYTVECEIKLSRSDYKRDFRKVDKHRRLSSTGGTRVPTRFFFVVPAMLVSPRDVPDYAGLIYCRWSTNVSASRSWAPLCTVIRHAPRLHSGKVTEKTVRAMRQCAYWRFWSERFSYEDYRRSAARADWARAAV